jgi:hypothetical protein
MRKHHAAFRVVGVRQRQEAAREEILVADLVRARRRQRIPAGPRRQFDADAALHRLAARHRDALRQAVGEIITLAKDIAVFLLDLRLGRDHARHDRGEGFHDVDRHVASLAAWLRLLLRVGIAAEGGGGGNGQDCPCRSAGRSDQDRPPAARLSPAGAVGDAQHGGNQGQDGTYDRLAKWRCLRHSQEAGRRTSVYRGRMARPPVWWKRPCAQSPGRYDRDRRPAAQHYTHLARLAKLPPTLTHRRGEIESRCRDVAVRRKIVRKSVGSWDAV